ncbi:MAG: hypothetical protein JSU79_05140 [Dehalococcoidales bacterium]|nr:MAG: hypothetical protein JSU79_05140 [Dehalococcoidales bacterium]
MNNNNQDFEEKSQEIEQDTTSIVQVEDMTVDEIQLTEQLYYSAGLDPIVDAGIQDYDKKIEQENKLINKVFGTRGSDVRGYGEAVARRVSYAIYNLLNTQYGGRVGNMKSYIMSLEEERDHANRRYDDLMGRVIGILSDEYKDLRTDSQEFIEKLTQTLGDDLKDAKIDQKALAERLADIDGLRAQITALSNEKEQLKDKHESLITELKNGHKEEVKNLEAQIDTLNKEQVTLNDKHESQIVGLKNEHKEEVKNLEAQIDTLNKEQVKLNDRHESQIDAMNKEQVKLNDKHDSQLAELKSGHKEEIGNLKSQIETLNKETVRLNEEHQAQVADLESKIEGLESEKTTLTGDLTELRNDYSELKAAIATLAETVPGEETGKKQSEDLYSFILKDSKVPSAVLKGVDQFIDFKKYLAMAVENGVKEVCTRVEKILTATRSE